MLTCVTTSQLSQSVHWIVDASSVLPVDVTAFVLDAERGAQESSNGCAVAADSHLVYIQQTVVSR